MAFISLDLFGFPGFGFFVFLGFGSFCFSGFGYFLVFRILLVFLRFGLVRFFVFLDLDLFGLSDIVSSLTVQI